MDTSADLYVSRLEKLPYETLQYLSTKKDQERLIHLKLNIANTITIPEEDKDTTVDDSLCDKFTDSVQITDKDKKPIMSQGTDERSQESEGSEEGEEQARKLKESKQEFYRMVDQEEFF